MGSSPAMFYSADEGSSSYRAGVLKDKVVVDSFDEGSSSYPAGVLKGKDAVVFWDPLDYPIDHESVFLKIRETLSDCPKVSIHAYVHKSKLSDELRRKYEDAQIIIHELSRGEKANWNILVDIRKLDIMTRDGRLNLFVLSKHFTEVNMLAMLETLHERGWGVCFSETGDREEYGCDPLPSDSFLTSLFTNKRKREGKGEAEADTREAEAEADTPDDDDSLTPYSFSISNFGDFSCCYDDTCIYLIMDDFCNLENMLVLREKLDKALVKKGYHGRKTYWGQYFNKPDDDDDLKYGCSGSGRDRWGLDCVAYNEGAGFARVLAEILGMIMPHIRRWRSLSYCYLVILSNNEKFLQGTSSLAGFLKKNCICNVVIAKIDQLEQESVMEEDDLDKSVTHIPPYHRDRRRIIY